MCACDTDDDPNADDHGAAGCLFLLFLALFVFLALVFAAAADGGIVL